MSAVSAETAAPLLAWQSPEVRAVAARMLGGAPLRIGLERTHFPGKRAIQMTLRAQMPGGAVRDLLAEYCPEDAQSHAERARASLKKSRNGQKPGLGSASVCVAGDSGLVLRQPGLDERLPGLRLLHEPGFARDVLGTILERDPGPVQVTLVAHRLGKRAVLRLGSADRVFYARLRAIKSGDGDARLARHRALWNGLLRQDHLRIPEPVGALPRIGVSVFGVLPGAPPGFSAGECAAIARAIAALQSLELADLPVHTGADEARLLADWRARCRVWRPDIQVRMEPGLEHVLAALERLRMPPRPCHRDLHEKQILIADGVAGLLDFDTLCLSDPALDAGNLLAHLFFAGVDEAPLRAHLSQPNIGLWRCAALYRLAMIYAFTSTSDAALDRLISEANKHAED